MTQFFLAATLDVLLSTGTYLVLRRNVVRVIWGIGITSQSANVCLTIMDGFDGLVFILSGHGVNRPTSLDPIVQAFALTAIVIGFGTTAFALMLTHRVCEEHGTIDMYELGRSR